MRWIMLSLKSCSSLALVLIYLGTSSCGLDGFIGNCEKYEGTSSIMYMGGAIGHGTLALKVAQSRKDELYAKLTLWDDTGTDAVIHLEGTGTCDQGILRIRFGGGDHPDAKIKVLGGNFVGVPDPELFGWLFGAWDVHALIKETNTTRVLEGLLREVPAKGDEEAK